MYGDTRMGCVCGWGQSTCIHKSGHRTSLPIILPGRGLQCSALSSLVDWLVRLAGPLLRILPPLVCSFPTLSLFWSSASPACLPLPCSSAPAGSCWSATSSRLEREESQRESEQGRQRIPQVEWERILEEGRSSDWRGERREETRFVGGSRFWARGDQGRRGQGLKERVGLNCLGHRRTGALLLNRQTHVCRSSFPRREEKHCTVVTGRTSLY